MRHLLYTSTWMGVPPLMFTPTHSMAFLCISMFWGYLCDMGNISLMLGSWGIPLSVGHFGGISTWGVHVLILVHSCSSLCLMFYYSYDYYSSSYGGVFWAVICFISDCGSFPDGASCNIGSAWSGSTTTLDAKRLWRCYWPCLCATAATSIFDVSSGLCQLYYGFSTGRFLFQS